MGQDAEQAALDGKNYSAISRYDIVVVGAAMYNFGLPSTLKAWIDRISVADDFQYTENGPVGLAGDKKAYIASSRGGVYGANSPADFQKVFCKPSLTSQVLGCVEIIRAEGVNMGPELKEQAIAAALAQVQAL